MKWLLYILTAAYFAWLVWGIFAPWHTASMGYLIACIWFVFWFLEILDGRRLNKKLHRQQIQHVHDMVKFTKEVMKMIADFGRDMEKEVSKERAHWEKVERGHQRRIGDLQQVIKIYAENEAKREAESKKKRKR